MQAEAEGLPGFMWEQDAAGCEHQLSWSELKLPYRAHRCSGGGGSPA